jgi:hypothetical protein
MHVGKRLVNNIEVEIWPKSTDLELAALSEGIFYEVTQPLVVRLMLFCTMRSLRRILWISIFGRSLRGSCLDLGLYRENETNLKLRELLTSTRMEVVWGSVILLGTLRDSKSKPAIIQLRDQFPKYAWIATIALNQIELGPLEKSLVGFTGKYQQEKTGTVDLDPN